MLKTHKKNKDNCFNVFKREKVITLKRLVCLLKRCNRTAQIYLKQWKTYTSYNQNSCYYALPDIPKFDSNGLWRYKGIFFSRYGNLKETVIHLVNDSEAGLTGTEIGELSGVKPKSFLSHFRNLPQLYREKINDRFIYFSSDKTLLTKQMKKRQDDNTRANLLKPPTDAETVIILVERIKHPQLSIKELSIRLSKKGCRIQEEVIRNFFEKHGFLKKKRDTQR